MFCSPDHPRKVVEEIRLFVLLLPKETRVSEPILHDHERFDVRVLHARVQEFQRFVHTRQSLDDNVCDIGGIVLRVSVRMEG